MKKLILTFITSTLLLVAGDSFAIAEYLPGFISIYPKTVDTPLNDCTICHRSGRGGLLNSYGLEFVMNEYNFKNIESQDSDGDGVVNIDEIIALTHPADGPNDQIKAFIFDKKGYMGKVRFDHTAHQYKGQYMSGGNCASCHQNGDFSKFISFTTNGDDRKAKAHGLCYGCHTEANGYGNTNAPMVCDQCHKADDGGVWSEP
ncbi:MAG: cytochrome c3 family protein [Bacteriovoracaceae bacterium]|jgi:hypothetical protein|nr:cytochrome c3 family protein [Bacteriovoracaceae bacterium]